jgi:hypothetical protein
MADPELLPELRVRGWAAARASLADVGAALQLHPLQLHPRRHARSLGFDLASAVARRAAATQADEDRAEVRARLAALLPPGLALAEVRYELDADGGVLGGCASADYASRVRRRAYGPVTPELLREAARIAMAAATRHAGIELAVDGIGVTTLNVHAIGDAGKCFISRVEHLSVLRKSIYVDGLARFRVPSKFHRVGPASARGGDDPATLPLPWLKGDDDVLTPLLALAYPVYEVARGARLDIELDNLSWYCSSRDAAHRALLRLDMPADPWIEGDPVDPSISRDFLHVVRATVAGIGDRLTARTIDFLN